MSERAGDRFCTGCSCACVEVPAARVVAFFSMFTDEDHMWVVVSSVSAFNGGEMFRLDAVVHNAISADSTFSLLTMARSHQAARVSALFFMVPLLASVMAN